ncbi:glyoxalase superfamily protein [Roseobacter sinensis]|uniref:Glyoxalase superfamily protein n=1 Tax=Roseobacter sinensis TaxID=2931391 RepID=A0ABT3BC90_9RHOB|nr:glyoxalase superfamily protein [Roseobacter sp. WL0113]MCV3271167.1 glyoxalase superfamily protein [Roseobacter sp. WL0113]
MDIALPSRDALKAQARRLRTKLAETGLTLSHSAALEAIAHQWGARDWNTLCARAGSAPAPVWQVGQRVSGRYLGHPVRGEIRAAERRGPTHWRLTLRLDEAVDVVASRQFSSLRRQISCTLDATGRSPQKTSDGAPQMVLHDHWTKP